MLTNAKLNRIYYKLLFAEGIEIFHSCYTSLDGWMLLDGCVRWQQELAEPLTDYSTAARSACGER